MKQVKSCHTYIKNKINTLAATFSALIIDDVYLSDYTPLGKNIDSAMVYPFISEAQDIYMQDILGTNFYNDLLYRSVYATSSITTYEESLLDILSKMVAYYSVYLAIPHLSIKIRNIGVAKSSADNTQSASLEEMKYIREEIKNLAEFWSQRAIVYLCNNSVHFPLYLKSGDDIQPNMSTQYDSDIYLDDTYYGLSYDELKFLKKYIGK
jgi:hypothetical protein